jgi:TetR/AcrR family transcriptional repressor of nem operon
MAPPSPVRLAVNAAVTTPAFESAARLFCARGFDSVSIGDVTADAGLTHGGFYAHFRSKRELYAEAVTTAASTSARSRFSREGTSGTALIEVLLKSYLDIDHARGRQQSCPPAFQATDVANRDEDVRAAYTAVFKRMVAVISRNLPSDTPSRRDRALALSAMMVGGVAVSRALVDDGAAHSLLNACVDMGKAFIEGR